MTQCLFGHIELLEHQIDSHGRDRVDSKSPASHDDIEEMMAVYVFLFREFEKSVCRASPRGAWNQAAVDERMPMYQRYVRLGESMRDLARKTFDHKPGGLDEFMQCFILARVGATAGPDSAAILKAVAGEIPTRTLRDPADELSNSADPSVG